MRTKSFIPLLGLMLLLMAVSCTDPIAVNPNYNPETNSVMTNLVFSISTPGSTPTKQNEQAVQENGYFWGIDSAILLSYVNKMGDNKILPRDSSAGEKYDLGVVASPLFINSTNSKRVLEISLPLGTNTLLFYGKEIMPDAASAYGGYTKFDCFGKLDAFAVDANSGSANFQLARRLGDTASFYNSERLLAGIITLVMNTNMKETIGGETNYKSLAADATPGGAIGGVLPPAYLFAVTTSDYGDTLHWRHYAQDGTSPLDRTHALYPLEKKLSILYSQMTTIYSDNGELRAASGEALCRTIQDLWTTINEVRCATPLNKEEALAKYFAYLVDKRLREFFNSTSWNNTGAPVLGVDFLETSTVITNFKSDYKGNPTIPMISNTNGMWPTDAGLAQVQSYFGNNLLTNFPFIFSLPRGATHMAFNKNPDKLYFYYPKSFNTSGMGGASGGEELVDGAFTAMSYYYPASLMYYGNSDIRASNQDHQAADYPNLSGEGTDQWSNDGSWTSDWQYSAVSSATRSVAMKKEIRYGVALLKTQVTYGVEELKDNRHNCIAEQQGVLPIDLPGEPDSTIVVNANSFKLTGVIVGGQVQNVGWDYLPIQTPGRPDTLDGFIYDVAVPDTSKVIPAYGQGSSKPNYTVVFDNLYAHEVNGIQVPYGTQKTVYVALEFQNNTGSDFYGNHNLIRNGGYFYLIGALDPAQATGALTWPTAGGYVFPPYAADGTSQQVDRVFIQSFMTSALFRFGENSLKYAYLTVPDLRSGSMSLGLSVNINWETGLQFNSLLGGN